VSKLKLSLACWNYDRTRALMDGSVRPDGIELNYLDLPVEETFFRMLRNRDFDGAIASERLALALSPQYNGAHNLMSVSLIAKGDAAGALAEAEAESSETWRMISVTAAYYAAGRKAESDAALSEIVAKLEKDASYNIAYTYAFRGEADRAFEWLDKAVQYNDGGLSEIVHEQFFDKIHSDPRWLPFLRKIGRAPEQLARIEFKVTLPQAEGATANSTPHP